MIEAVKVVPRAQREIKFTDKNLGNFWGKVNKDGPTMLHMESACWSWMAHKNQKGYGHFRIVGAIFYAHRASWVINRGPIASGICVCHRCDNPSCVNPDHLFLGTTAENIHDRDAKKRGNQPVGEAHNSAKLNELQVGEIRSLYATGGISQRKLAAQFKVTQPVVGRIIRRELWKHICDTGKPTFEVVEIAALNE
jgi:hypothetical protein